MTYVIETPLHVPDGTPQTPTTPVTYDGVLHHCVSHKLLIIIGASNDTSINNAAQWGLQLHNVEHKLFFKLGGDGVPNMSEPWVPNSEGKSYERYSEQKPGDRKPKPASTADLVAATFKDCCQFDEVMIAAHAAAQKSCGKTLITSLPRFSTTGLFVDWRSGYAAAPILCIRARKTTTTNSWPGYSIQRIVRIPADAVVRTPTA